MSGWPALPRECRDDAPGDAVDGVVVRLGAQASAGGASVTDPRLAFALLAAAERRRRSQGGGPPPQLVIERGWENEALSEAVRRWLPDSPILTQAAAAHFAPPGAPSGAAPADAGPLVSAAELSMLLSPSDEHS